MANKRLESEEARAKELLKESLPALITGGAGDDPAGVLTYTVVGATTGFSQLWLLVLSTPMLAAANSMAARIAVAAHDGLAAVVRKRYGRAAALIIVLVLAIANIATIAADAAGVASALQIATGVRWEFFVPLILVSLLVVLHRGYTQIKRILVFLTAVLLAYVAAAIMAKPDWAALLQATFAPHIGGHKAWTMASLGLLGTTISPYLLFWQAGEEVEELQEGITIQASETGLGVWPGMVYSNLIAFFIIVAAAMTIHAGGGHIQSVADAAQALAPLGKAGVAIFIVGIVGSGLLALPVLAGSTAYAIAELMGWPEGFGARGAHARGFLVVLVAALGGGMLISLWPNFRPAEALYYSQVLDGVLLPVLMLILLVLSNDRRVVGSAKNPLWVNGIAAFTILIAFAADAAALVLH
ncbi:MAG TPA: divalent metal cation transporter [Chloroflexi bacterium]|nr:divalent metal cation transporter [Chloroflexota bacterium]